MVKRTGSRMTTSDEEKGDMPAWASKLIEGFDSYSSCMQLSLTDTFDRVFTKMNDLLETQSSIVSRLSELEKKISSIPPPHSRQSLLYSTLVKVKADNKRIDEKLRMITWIGIDEQIDEDAT
ncbi:hypothetical protein Y032_0082g1600 [Ancylostoma ceylanicum]|uniref:Biogenesis of lysosome-related organelles complex 1 subunit 7 n=1 Tax=Ancylostoma ceylanicum TaxID=53326 RepID=A0A016TRT2_9BILA|nr:hypothetical protein Y032_0082g1600 [Ancylostoma ceylanicum]